MIEIRSASQQDAERWFKERPAFSFKGYVAEQDGELLGIGGIFRAGGRRYVFAEMTCGAHQYAKSILKLAKKVIKDVGDDTVYAMRQEDEPTSARFLHHLGFHQVGDDKTLYRRN